MVFGPSPILCEYGRLLDVNYTVAWMSRNHDQVMKYQKEIREHLESCLICQGMALVDELWPGVKVARSEPFVIHDDWKNYESENS